MGCQSTQKEKPITSSIKAEQAKQHINKDLHSICYLDATAIHIFAFQSQELLIVSHSQTYDVPPAFIQLDHQLYTAGGLQKQVPQSDCTLFSMSEGLTSLTKCVLAHMQVAKAENTLVALQSEYLYSVGGRIADSRLTVCERYYILSNRWENVASLTTARSQVACCVYKNSTLYAFGGLSATKTYSKCVERLEHTAALQASWEPLNVDGLYNPEVLIGVVCHEYENNILICTGYTTHACWLYSPKDKSLETGHLDGIEDSNSPLRLLVGGQGTLCCIDSALKVITHKIGENKWTLVPTSAWSQRRLPIQVDPKS